MLDQFKLRVEDAVSAFLFGLERGEERLLWLLLGLRGICFVADLEVPLRVPLFGTRVEEERLHPVEPRQMGTRGHALLLSQAKFSDQIARGFLVDGGQT